jgi:hypothetical protein
MSQTPVNSINDLGTELADLKGFIADLKQDRADQKEKEKRESWTKYTAISLVFIAVLAAVANQWSGKYGSQVLTQLNLSTYNQALASDQWSYYQAKSIKQNLYEALREMAPKSADANGPEATQSLAAFNAKVAKYKADEKEIMDLARKYEAERDAARTEAKRAGEHGGRMGTAISIYQIAIALGSISLVTKKRYLWFLSTTLAAVAVGQMIHVWMM